MPRKILRLKKNSVEKSVESEIETVKNMLSHLENEYRKAKISDKSYKELHDKYNKKLDRLVLGGTDGEPEIKRDGGGFFRRFLGKKKAEEPKLEEQLSEAITATKTEPEKPDPKLEAGEIEEVTPEVIEKLAQQMAGDENVSMDDVEEESDSLAPSEGEGAADNKFAVELEKVKVMLETIRGTQHVTDETIQNISESIGEMRSMIFQTDAGLKESMVKMEKIEDDVSSVRPQEVAKRSRELDIKLETMDLQLEKLDTKSKTQGERLNKIIEILRVVGGLENLMDINKKIQNRLQDVKEAERYIERVGNKIEKIYIDLNRGLEDLILIRAKQEDFDENVKDMVKSMDTINVKFGGYMTKKDMEDLREELIVIEKKVNEMDKVIPIAELKIPETVLNLRRDREDIRMILEVVEEQFKNKELTKDEYEKINTSNNKKLDEIKKRLKKEWAKFERMFKKGQKIPEQTQQTETTEQMPKTTQPEQPATEVPVEQSETSEKKETPESVEEKAPEPEPKPKKKKRKTKKKKEDEAPVEEEQPKEELEEPEKKLEKGELLDQLSEPEKTKLLEPVEEEKVKEEPKEEVEEEDKETKERVERLGLHVSNSYLSDEEQESIIKKITDGDIRTIKQVKEEIESVIEARENKPQIKKKKSKKPHKKQKKKSGALKKKESILRSLRRR